jgi:hypothetical protein
MAEKIKSQKNGSGKSTGGRNRAPTEALQKEQDLDARMAKAGRTRTPGHAENSYQNRYQQSLANKEVDRSDAVRRKAAGMKKRTKSRSSNKKYENQK